MEQRQRQEGVPTSFESVRAAMVSFLRKCEPHMAKYRDRELIKSEIERLAYNSAGGLKTAMKSTGIVRKIDDLGRIVIPKELRRTMGIAETDPLEIYTDEDTQSVYLKKYNMKRCVFCDSEEDVTRFKMKHMCERCVSELFDTSDVKL